MAVRMPPWLRVSNARVLHLPIKSRSPTRLLRLLRPAFMAEPLRALVWVICKGPHCYACIWPEGNYEVTLRRSRAHDRLSGLTHRIVVEVDGRVGDDTVWKARWDGTFLVVEEFRCRARVSPDGRVMCANGMECRGASCLAECLTSQ